MTLDGNIELLAGGATGNIDDGTVDYQVPVWDATAGKYVVSSILKVDDDLETVTITGNAGNPQQVWAYTPGSVESSLKTDAAGVTTLATSGNSFVFPAGTAANPGIAIGASNSGIMLDTGALYLVSSGSPRWKAVQSTFGSTATGGGYLAGSSSSSTIPFVSVTGDTNTGVGNAGSDQLSLISGGVEGQRIVEDAAWGISTHFPSVSAAPTAIAGMACIYELSGNLYWQDSSGTSRQITAT